MKLKRTKIVATISALNCDVQFIRRLHEAGMDVARLNTAHMSTEEAEKVVANIREVSDKIGILIDTKGPEVRICNLEEPLPVKIGDRVLVSSEPVAAGKGFQVNYLHFCDEVKPDQRMLLDDGAMALMIREKQRNVLVCEVLNEGIVKNKKTVNVPDTEMNMPSLTKKDRDFIEFAIRSKLDFIAHSFVRNRDDVMAVQSLLDTDQSPIKIIAKIENRQGVRNLDSILDVAYGIMVARGDLGVEIPAEEVPLTQKKIIYECMRRRKPVITATQMLQSMIDNPRPTRAEVSDVANAVFDGTDAVMLSGETAQGKFPLEAVSTMASIIRQAETGSSEHFTLVKDVECADDVIRAYVVKNAIDAAGRLPVKAILCNTTTGSAARLCAAYRGPVPVFALSSRSHVVRQLSLSFGVYASHNDFHEQGNVLFLTSAKILLQEGKIDPDDLIALLGNYPGDKKGTNKLIFTTLRAIVEANAVKE